MPNPSEDVTRAYDLMEEIMFCMLATRDGGAIRARPMAAQIDRDEHAIYFLTDSASHKDEEVERAPEVCLAFADSKGQNYVSVSGRASVSNDRQKIRELFSTPSKAWWDDADDPSIRVLKVEPDFAEYWDGPGTAASYVKMIAAAVGDARPDMGDNAKLRM